ncbi:MAG TPA: DUF5684 domain-containing protein [Galbitalea sp.]|nr:DUF5684 domain-containing protein [Galbitalea sp.]
MNYGYGDPSGATFAILVTVYAVVFGIEFLVFAAIYIVSGIGFMKLFRKVGVEPWAAWVPFFNTWRMLEVGGQPGALSILQIVPIANYVPAVFQAISAYKVGAAMRKEGAWVVLFIFLPFVWAWIVGDDKTPYDPTIMAANGWKPPLAGYGSVRGPYVPNTPPPPAA